MSFFIVAFFIALFGSRLGVILEDGAIEGRASLLIADKFGIRRMSMDGKNISQLVNSTKNCPAIDFDFKTSMLYWSDSNADRIYRSPLDEGYRAEVILDGDASAKGLAVDWIYNHLYWTNAFKKTIEMSSLDGKRRRIVIADKLREPGSLALDPLDGWLYWSNWGRNPAGKIERAGMDGSNRQTIIDKDVARPSGITLDYVQKKVYWIDAKLHLIGSCNYDGSEKRIIIQKRNDLIGFPFSITTFEDAIYWSYSSLRFPDENLAFTIMKVNKFTGMDAKPIVESPSTLENFVTIRVYHRYRQPFGQNLCEHLNSRCSYLCVPKPMKNKSLRPICVCPYGSMIQNDSFTCIHCGDNCDIPIIPTSTDEAQGLGDSYPLNFGGLVAGIIFGTIILVGCAVLVYYRRKFVHQGPIRAFIQYIWDPQSDLEEEDVIYLRDITP